MSDRNSRNGKALSLMIVSMLALSGAAVLLGAMSAPTRAATCDQGGSTILGDWTITSPEVCSGILYTVDGSITIGSGGSLTLINGGLNFAKDTSHRGYSLTVSAGGSLILDNSIVTVQTTAIDPYLKLALQVSGAGSSFTMTNGSVLKFPGWFNATGTTITMANSAITGFLPGDLTNVGVYVGDNDNSPLISWSSTTASLYASQIARIYENTSSADKVNVTGPMQGNVALTSSSTLYAYDSYIGVHFSNIGTGSTCPCLHNELTVDATSNAYLYNVTIDQTETPTQESQWAPAFVPLSTSATGGSIYLLRWAQVQVVDAVGFPVSGASLAATSSPQGTTAVYPDNGGLTTPSARTLTYLGKSASGTNAYTTTNSNGMAKIPLYTDLINQWSLPNANSSGNFALTATYAPASATATGGVNFNPYPAVTWQDNNAFVTIQLSNVHVQTGPDLVLRQSDYTATVTAYQNQPFSVDALIYNDGQTDATGVSIAAFLDANTTALARVDNLAIAAGENLTQPLNFTNGVSGIGSHTLELIVDPDNTINEGGVAQESNNFANVTLNILAPPNGAVSILAPVAGLTIAPGSTLDVTGYVRDTNSLPISGVVLNIKLMSGSTEIVSGTATSQKDTGFFLVVLTIPAGTADGSYQIQVTSTASSIQSDTTTISVLAPASFLNTPVPLLGIAWWLFLIILAIIVAAVVGITLYFKVYGLGKMVECGECGAFIPEDATVCPKCGVEFEKDMAKCSNCQAWIPVDVRQCPECGVEFATGQLDMADYQEKMRLQYDEVVQKFKEDASRQLGRALSEQEFQEWWRKQPTFLTFEDWLHEEEEMRKQGSKGCPVCGTLNSVTAKVCHKCGSLMAAPAAKPGGAVRVGAPKRAVKPAAPPAPPPAPSEEAPEPSGPVVQKRVIKRTPAEGEQTEGQGQDDQNL